MKLIRHLVLIPFVLLLAAVHADSSVRVAAARPNVVFILTDDQDLLLNSLSFMPQTIPPGGLTVFTAFKATTTYFAPSPKDFMFNLMVDNLEEALAQVKKMYADIPMMRARINRSVEVLRAQAGKAPLDPARIAALGFCFGGSSVLELARSGADVAGVVTFHGGLDTSMPAQSGVIKAPLLILNGAEDKNTAPDIAGFEKEMNAAGADWQFVNFSGAVHCFALPTANKPPGCLYNELAARRSERMMRVFFAEKFAN